MNEEAPQKADYEKAIRNIEKVISERQKLNLPLRVPLDALVHAEKNFKEFNNRKF